MQGADVRRVFETILPEELLLELVREARFQERERKLEAVGLIRAMLIAAATGYGGRQADVMRIYFENGAGRVARGGFYRWFGPALERVMVQVRDHALDYGKAMPLDVPGLLGRRLRFEIDGSVRHEFIETCGGSTSVYDGTWSVVDDAKVRAPRPDLPGLDAFVLGRLPGRDEFRLIWVLDGQEGGSDPMYRGEVCADQWKCPDEEGNEVLCGCRRYYCDGAGPEALDCE